MADLSSYATPVDCNSNGDEDFDNFTLQTLLKVIASAAINSLLGAACYKFDHGLDMKISPGYQGLQVTPIKIFSRGDNLVILSSQEDVSIYKSIRVCHNKYCEVLPHQRKYGFLAVDNPT